MSLKYIYNKLENMSTDEQYEYIKDLFDHFEIKPLYPIEDNFKDIPGKQSEFKNPTGYLILHFLDNMEALVDNYIRSLCITDTFDTSIDNEILDVIDQAQAAITTDSFASMPCLIDQNNDTTFKADMPLVFEFGRHKYHDWSFLKLNPYTLIPALFRHLYKYYYVSKIDEETGLSHLAHAQCNLNMIELILSTRGNNV